MRKFYIEFKIWQSVIAKLSWTHYLAILPIKIENERNYYILIKKWSTEYTKEYGKCYDYTNLSRFRKFYLLFQKGQTVSAQLTWSHFVEILSISNENERDYYINQCILNNLSVRELRQEIKNKSFDRLSYADKENIKLIESDNYSLTIEDMIKDPIIIEVNNIDNFSEKVLHQYIIEMLDNNDIITFSKGAPLKH